MIDFARWYVGDIRKVSAHLATFVDRPGADGQPSIPTNESAFVTLQFDNEAQAMVHASVLAHQADRAASISIRLHGDAGTLEAEQIFFGAEAGAVIRGARQGEEQFDLLTVPENLAKNLDGNDIFDPYKKQAVGPRLFIDAIINEQPMTPNFYDGLKVQEVIDAAIEAHRKECWVSLT